MQTPHIQTFNGQPVGPNTFYALCKGENAGKPLLQPCPNCFTVTCSSELERDYYYWLTWGLWKGKTFRYYLTGSVIPFIRISDYKAVIDSRGLGKVENPEQLTRAIQTMRDLEALEAATLQKLLLVKQMRVAVYDKLLKRSV